jgi:hypothetical protein
MELELKLVPLSPAAWTQFTSWYAIRATEQGLEPWAPPMPEHGIWVAAEDRLVAGLCVYPTSGPIAVAEYASVDPAAPLRLRYAALKVIAKTLRLYGPMTGKVVMIFPRHRGTTKLLERHGYKSNPCVPMYAEPVYRVGTVKMKPGATKPRVSHTRKDRHQPTPDKVATKRRRSKQ